MVIGRSREAKAGAQAFICDIYPRAHHNPPLFDVDAHVPRVLHAFHAFDEVKKLALRKDAAEMRSSAKGGMSVGESGSGFCCTAAERFPRVRRQARREAHPLWAPGGAPVI